MSSEAGEAAAPIPMTVIGGFLGAGKTSYLNDLIRSGLAPGSLILVNDFGDIDIDGALIDYQDDRVISLTNGCICCTLGGTLAEQLAEALRFTPPPTAIYIEASGVANPARIADIARISPKLHLAEVVCVIDASQALANADHPQIGAAWREQVVAADRLLLNRKVKDTTHHETTDRLLDSLNPGATRLELPMPAGAPEPRVAPPPPRFASGSPSKGHPWRSVTLTPSGEVDADGVTQLLEAYADVLTRAKGFLRCRGHARPRLLQFSGGRSRWQSTLRPSTEPRLVLIGLDSPRFDALCKAVKALADIDHTNGETAPR